MCLRERACRREHARGRAFTREPGWEGWGRMGKGIVSWNSAKEFMPVPGYLYINYTYLYTRGAYVRCVYGVTTSACFSGERFFNENGGGGKYSFVEPCYTIVMLMARSYFRICCAWDVIISLSFKFLI